MMGLCVYPPNNMYTGFSLYKDNLDTNHLADFPVFNFGVTYLSIWFHNNEHSNGGPFHFHCLSSIRFTGDYMKTDRYICL